MIPFTDYGGEGSRLHFMHANGYPPGCYLPLIELLRQEHHVSAMHLRPLWPHARPAEIGAWHPLSDDFLLYLDEQKISPLVAVGHSMGGIISLRTALRKPDHFRALVMIDPVLFTPRMIAAYNLVKLIGLGSRLVPVMKGALKRRRRFEDLESLFHSYRRKGIFRYMDDEALRVYIRGITRPAPGGGYELVFSPEWEARIYATGIWRDMDLWWGLPRLKVPTLVIRGAETDTFMPGSAGHLKRVRPATQIVTLEHSTHLVPLEKPRETFEIIRDFLKENV